MTDALVVLQCRMGSRRLPGKALSDVCGRSLLARCIDRLRLAAVAPVLVATTTGAEDDAVVAEARRLGVDVYRGARDHVLERFVMAARRYGARLLVRATADNPAVDIDAPGRVLTAARAHGADHVTEQGLPYGAAVEAVSVAALETALTFSRDAYDHEHVTPFIIRRPERFRVVPVVAPEGLRRPELRLTVDTREDLLFMRQVLAAAAPADGSPATLAAIIQAADRIRRLPLEGAA
ncbi:MAG: NTP transferase domain-containing protein [Acidobacteriota bacterium]